MKSGIALTTIDFCTIQHTVYTYFKYKELCLDSKEALFQMIISHFLKYEGILPSSPHQILQQPRLPS